MPTIPIPPNFIPSQKKCKECDRILAKQNRTGYCLQHRELSPYRKQRKKRMLDFSILSDDQLLDLLKATMSEAIKRGGDIASAARGEVLSAQERAAIEFQVAEKIRLEKEDAERRRIAKETERRLREEDNKKQEEKVYSHWEIKAAAVEAIRKWGYDDEFEINIWSRGADRRIYFQKESSKRTSWKWCLYLSGNQWHPKGELIGEGVDSWFDDKKDKLKSLLIEVSKTWKGDVNIPCKYGDVSPSQKHLKKYLKAIDIDE
jgi:hypothetical protein